MGFNPDNYDLKKLSEYPEIEFGNDLPAAAFIPAVSLDENDALANFKIKLAKIRDFIIQTGDYTNVIDYRPTPYYSATELQLTINGGWRLECPNGFLQTGEYRNEYIEITEARHIDLSNQGAGKWVLFLTADDTYIVRQSNLLIRKSLESETGAILYTGTILYEVSTNTWWRYSGTDWNQLIGMPLINVEIASGAMSVSLTNSLMRNRLNLEYLLLQAGIEIPESRGPFERIISNVKKSGADLLYYIPAHTEVDLVNYPETLSLLQSAYQRAVAAGIISGGPYGDFYRDAQTGLDFAALAVYAQAYSDFGLCPFIGYSGSGSVFWTPKTAHGELIAEQKPTAANNYSWYRIYADQWIEQGGNMGTSATVNLLKEMAGANYFVDVTWNGGKSQEFYPVDWKITRSSTTAFTTTATTNGSNVRGLCWTVCGVVAGSVFAKIAGQNSYNEYYLIGNRLSDIPANLEGQLATILNAYNQIVQNGADFFSIQATDEADALAKSQANPTKFVYVAESVA